VALARPARAPTTGRHSLRTTAIIDPKSAGGGGGGGGGKGGMAQRGMGSMKNSGFVRVPALSATPLSPVWS
jgi:hypothetical protein